MPTLAHYTTQKALAVKPLSFKAYRKNRRVKGGALFGLIKPSNKMTNEAKKMLTKYGDHVIQDVKVYRQPVTPVIMKVLNAASLGDIKKNMKEVGYDKMYHLYCVVKLVSPDHSQFVYLLMEKNATINIEERRNLVAKHEEVGSKQRFARRGMTLKQLFEETVAREGEKTFFGYDAIKNNCQDFIMMLLATLYGNSSMIPPPLRNFVKQNRVAEVVDSPVIQSFAKQVTDLGGWFAKILGK